MQQTKNFRYYLLIFIIATLAIFIYATISAIIEGSFDVILLITMGVAPAVFTVFLFLFDRIFDMIFPKKLKDKQQNKDNYKAFLSVINKEVELHTDFSIEEYRRLRESEKFQKTLKQVFRIMENGETEELSYSYLLKKFKKTTNEFTALNIVIEEAKKLSENS